MNILIITQSFYPDVDGGSGRFVFELGKRLAQRGHRVTLMGERLNSGHRTRGSLGGMSVLRYGSPLLGAVLPWSFTSPFFVHSAAQAVSKKEDFDLVWCHHYFPGLGGSMFARRKGIPNLFTYHASRYLEWVDRAGQPRRFNSRFSRILLRWWADDAYSNVSLLVEKKCLKGSEAITVLSEFSQRQIEELHPAVAARVRVIPGGVDADRFRPVTDRKALRRDLGLPVEGLLVLTVRRLIARMGLENLIDAMTTVLENEPDACLLIGGRGYLHQSLRERIAQLGIEDAVRLVGFIDEALLPKYYAASDLFVLPTLSLEGFGMVTLEALSSGTPVLGSSAGATPEILRSLDPGLVLEGTEPQRLASGILKFAKMEGQEELRRRCRTFVEEHYRWDGVVDQMEKTMEEMVASGEL